MAIRHSHCRMVLLPWLMLFALGSAAVAAWGEIGVVAFALPFAFGWACWTFWNTICAAT